MLNNNSLGYSNYQDLEYYVIFNSSVNSGISRSQLTALILLSIIIFVSVFSTVLSNKCSSLLNCFNLEINHQALFREGKKSDNFDYILDFYKAVYILIAIFGHVVIGWNRVSHPIFLDTLNSAWKRGDIASMDASALFGSFNVSFTACILVHKVFKKSKALKDVIFKRTSQVLSVCFVSMLLLIILPIFIRSSTNKVLEESSSTCSSSFKELLFVSNLGDVHDTCIMVSWSQSLEIQLTLLFLIPLIFLKLNKKMGVACISIMITLGLVGHFLLLESIPSSFRTIMSFAPPFEDATERMRLLYFHPVGHVASFGVTILTAYLFINHGHNKEKNLFNHLSIVGVYCIFWIHTNLYNGVGVTTDFSRSTQILVGLLIRPMFAWIFISFLNAFDYILIKFISHRFFTLLSRMALSVYISHLVLVNLLQSQMQMPFVFSQSGHLFYASLMLPMSLILGYLVVLFVEYPVRNVVKELTKI